MYVNRRFLHALLCLVFLTGLGSRLLRAQVTYNPPEACVGGTVVVSDDTITWADVINVVLEIDPGNIISVNNFQNETDSISFDIPSFAFSGSQATVTPIIIYASLVDSFSLTPDLIVNRLEPTAVDAGSDQTICAGESVNLTASPVPGDGAYTYDWSPATGLSATNTATVSASPSSTTTYTVTVTGTSCGVQATDQVTVNVRAIPVLVDTTVTPPSCPGASDAEVRINATGSSALEFRLGTSAAFVPVANAFTGVDAGTYDLQLRYTSTPRCLQTFDDEVVITDPVLPPAEISTTPDGDPVSICAGETVTFTATDQPGATAYNWNFGNGASPQTASGRTPPAVTYATGGTYTAVLTMSVTAAACPVQASVEVVVIPLPNITAVTPSPTSDCGATDGSVQVTVSGGPGGFEYRLTGNGITRDWQSNSTFTGLPAGSYTVSVRYDDQICPVDWDEPVIVNDPGAPVSAINIAPLVDCAGEPIEISAPNQTGVTFTWDFGTGATPPSASGPGPHVVVYSSGGNKEIVLNLAEGECAGTERNDDLVILPVPEITLTPPLDPSYTDGDSLALTLSSDVEGTVFDWSLTLARGLVVGLDTAGTEEAIDLILELGSPDSARVTFEVIAVAEGCADTVTFSFVVNPETGEPEFVIPDIFTPNGDDFNDTWDISLVGNRDPRAYVLRVFNRSGALVHEDDLSAAWDGNTPAGSPVPTGAYWFIIVPADGADQPLAKGAVTLLR